MRSARSSCRTRPRAPPGWAVRPPANRVRRRASAITGPLAAANMRHGSTKAQRRTRERVAAIRRELEQERTKGGIEIRHTNRLPV